MKKLNYAEAQTELQQLLQELQDEKTDLDQLAEKVARARELIQFCRERLRLAEVEVNKLLEN